MWLSNYIEGSLTENTIPVVHQKREFYAIIAVTVVACGAFDLFMEANRVLRVQPPVDFLRSLVKRGKTLDDPIEAHLFARASDMAAELGK